MDCKQIEAHDSEMQKLHELVAATNATLTTEQRLRNATHMAKLIVSLVKSGHLKSKVTHGMALAELAAGDADAAIRAASGARK